MNGCSGQWFKKRTIKPLRTRTKEAVAVADFGVSRYAFDVITSVTFSNRIGFMEQEMDVQGIINAIEGRLAYNSVIGEAPVLHKYLLGNPVGSYLAS